MDLLRFPLVVLKEVFKNMDLREQFLISLLSKRANNTLQLSCVVPRFVFEFSSYLRIHCGHRPYRFPSATEEIYCIGGKSLRLSFHPEGLILKEQSMQNYLLLANYMLDTFKNPNVSVRFCNPTHPATALQFMKMVNERELSINVFDYNLTQDSSELIPKILNECTEVTELVTIDVYFPDDFVYTPPDPFKAKEIRIDGKCNWFNLKSFMCCPRITVLFNEKSNRTVECWSSFFTKWMDSDASLQNLWLKKIEENEKQLIIEALSNQGTQRKLDRGWIEVNRNNESILFFHVSSKEISIRTAHAYLEGLRMQDALIASMLGKLQNL
uniref:F-box domain-containing protein n=2 Tax=Caenorhabditis tropicalis TaxID=1561998 RepID=A0A1I7UTK3_9PELO